ncbi:unnamed protein product [Lupinus luteus]|uniref:Pectinesterase n=1 Tax=Lupinus luteus TaxID=3873 RepID=A0AAV1WNH8_LUPLU
MHNSKNFIPFSFLILIFRFSNALDCSSPPKVIDVNQSGQGGSFTTIQSAIDSIPVTNTQWTHIRISAGTYTETVFIAKNRPCIFLEGAGSSSTIVQASNHDTMSTSPTLTSLAEDIIAKDITFQNTYNNPGFAHANAVGILPALAAKVEGDRSAFYNCAFKGVQDTLWDRSGLHYYNNCYIQGAIDFIFGDGQSIYEKCTINVTTGIDGPIIDGVITAQKRESMDSTTGFVFKECTISGTKWKAELGRAYGPYSRVIIANSYLSDIVRPEGWSTWGKSEENLVYVEVNNTGSGANNPNRVKWMKTLSEDELKSFLDISYVDIDGWIAKQRKANNF